MPDAHPWPHDPPAAIGSRHYPPELPCGWYCIGHSQQLAVGQLIRLQVFGQAWVLFRTEAGQAALVEAYCPHLGAHLGHGGYIEGNWLRCPFHGWAFDNQGYCRDIPYARQPQRLIGRKAWLRSRVIHEEAGLIWAWHHALDEPPHWDPMPLHTDPNPCWSEYAGMSFDIACSTQDILENSADYAHLKYVHGHPSIPSGQAVYQGVQRQLRIETDMSYIDAHGKACRGPYSIDIQQRGPGQIAVLYSREVQLKMLFLVTPVAAERSQLRMLFAHPIHPAGSAEALALDNLKAEKIDSHGGMKGVLADIPIWEHKIYRARPLLCDGDLAIAQFRRWFAQFYPPRQ